MMFERLLSQAVSLRSTDIHIEPVEHKYRVRMRIDGHLRAGLEFTWESGRQLCSQIKVEAGMDVAQRLLPQDGSMHRLIDNRHFDLRVATQPSLQGEKVVLRLLPCEPINLDLEELGMSESVSLQFGRLIQRRQGLVLVTGPTGSGKTTTLYAGLNLIERASLNIMTLEDPVEYRLPDVIQTQVNYRSGLTFAVGLRGLLRQDPDVVLVGEIRDAETAAISVRAAMTGHLVLATLHSLTAQTAIARLLEMGCARYQVAAALNGVLAQRLVGRPCGCCEGCNRCLGTGYFGRLGVFELLSLSYSQRQEILAGVDPPQPVPGLLADCEARVQQGLTDARQLSRLVLELEGHV